jgi:hypothetical protein
VLVQIVREATSRVDRIEDSLSERLEVRRVDLGAAGVRPAATPAPPEPAALFRSPGHRNGLPNPTCRS